MRYAFEPPPGWIARPFPPPQQGVYLTSPPGTPHASILLEDAIEPSGTLLQQIEASLSEGCADVQILERIPAVPLPSHGLPGAAAAVRIKVVFEGSEHQEGRVFALFEGQRERLPVIFLGELSALPFHWAAMEGIFDSIRVLHAASELLY